MNDMANPNDDVLKAGMKAIHVRYQNELSNIELAKTLALEILEERQQISESKLVEEIVEKLRDQKLPATEYLASYATDYLRASGRGKKDWLHGTLRYEEPQENQNPQRGSVFDEGNRPDDDKSPDPDDVSRSDAEIDIDRVSYATEFRRLGGVTQVIPPQQDHLIHDRLTHSMKVAHVAAALARRVRIAAEDVKNEEDRKKLDGIDIKSLSSWVDPNFCYVAGLAHDIGHPPFGHAGEKALQQLLGQEESQEEGSDSGEPPQPQSRSFEGNAQSMRIVAKLCFRKEDEYKGLNLTYRSLAALAKYPWKQGENPSGVSKLEKKWSFYPEEADILDQLKTDEFIAVEESATPNKNVRVHRWPEAEIMDWADDIAYAAHDLEDFFRAGLIPLHRIGLGLTAADEETAEETVWAKTGFHLNDEEVAEALRFARHKMEKIPLGAGQSSTDFVEPAFRVIKESLARHFPLAAFDGTRRAQVSVQKFGSAINVYLMLNCWLQTVWVNNKPRVEFVVDPTARLVAEFFKAICHYFVIQSSTVSTMQKGHALSVQVMFENLENMAIEWVERSVKPPTESRELPARLREYIRMQSATSEEDPREKIRIAVVDYICSLRDEQASALTSRFKGHRDAFGMAAGWLDT
jgi:dGTPase